MGIDNISEQPSEGIVQLVGDIDATTVNPTVTISPASRVKTQVDNTPGNDTLLTTISLTVSSNKMLSGSSERMFLTGGVEDTAKDNVAYTATVRGLFNTNLTNPPTSSDGGDRNFTAHTNGARCILDETWLTRELQSLFSAGTTVASASAGENITIRESVSLESNGDLRLYNSVTFPNVVGIANETKTTGQATQYTTFGGLSTGHSGLTPGGDVFAENTGVVTQTGSATAVKIGVAETATTIRIVSVGATVELTQNQIEDSTDSTFGVTSGLRNFQGRLMTRPRYSTNFADLVTNGSTGTGTESIVGGGMQFSETTGQFSSWNYDSNFIGSVGAVFSGHDFFTFTMPSVNLTVDGMEVFFGISNALLTTTTVPSVDSNFAGFHIIRESGTTNIYALTQRGTATQTRELVATGNPIAAFYAIDINFGTDVKYYLNQTLEATHNTIANIPDVADRTIGWGHNGAGSGTLSFTFAHSEYFNLA